MVGKTMVSVSSSTYADEMVFTATDGKQFKFYHSQDCCESVGVEEIIGDLQDLIGSPILEAEEVSSDGTNPTCGSESYTWTFYRYVTAKGTVTVRWLGTSNGYYSEGVSFTAL
jgi:hypothetical protein